MGRALRRRRQGRRGPHQAGFADDGGTVLLSSHLLHEVELIADDLVVIEAGRIVARGAVADFTSHGAHSLEDAFFSLTA